MEGNPDQELQRLHRRVGRVESEDLVGERDGEGIRRAEEPGSTGYWEDELSEQRSVEQQEATGEQDSHYF